MRRRIVKVFLGMHSHGELKVPDAKFFSKIPGIIDPNRNTTIIVDRVTNPEGVRNCRDNLASLLALEEPILAKLPRSLSKMAYVARELGITKAQLNLDLSDLNFVHAYQELKDGGVSPESLRIIRLTNLLIRVLKESRENDLRRFEHFDDVDFVDDFGFVRETLLLNRKIPGKVRIVFEPMEFEITAAVLLEDGFIELLQRGSMPPGNLRFILESGLMMARRHFNIARMAASIDPETDVIVVMGSAHKSIVEALEHVGLNVELDTTPESKADIYSDIYHRLSLECMFGRPTPVFLQSILDEMMGPILARL